MDYFESRCFWSDVLVTVTTRNSDFIFVINIFAVQTKKKKPDGHKMGRNKVFIIHALICFF